MNDESVRIRNDSVAESSSHCPGICLEDLSKTTKALRMIGVPAETRAEHLMIRVYSATSSDVMQ
jgi:hypothetical protein